MIEIKEKEKCCGCEACVQRCPKKCISLNEDEEGFLYPKADENICIQCGLCEKVCPVINQRTPVTPQEVFVAKNSDEDVRLGSSSGGIFTMIAEKVIDAGGVVFGVGFDEKWEAVHKYTEEKAGLAEFRGSKYVQSHVGATFLQAEQFLKQGRQVLYSGTPCQISGLKHFLRKDYPNLLTVDFICHGTPSPGVFRQYIEEERERAASKGCEMKIERIAFRDKSRGWKNFSFVIQFYGDGGQKTVSQPVNTNPYLRGFLKNLYLRPSCHACPAKLLKSGSDITLGDFWGVVRLMPQEDDDKGISAITLNTERGVQALNEIPLSKKTITYEDLQKTNSALAHSTPIPVNRAAFYSDSENSLIRKINKYAPIDYKRQIKKFIKKLIGRN